MEINEKLLVTITIDHCSDPTDIIGEVNRALRNFGSKLKFIDVTQELEAKDDCPYLLVETE